MLSLFYSDYFYRGISGKICHSHSFVSYRNRALTYTELEDLGGLVVMELQSL